MARKKKPSGRLIDGPFTADHFDRALKLDGWILAAKLEHWHYQHPDRPGKAPGRPEVATREEQPLGLQGRLLAGRLLEAAVAGAAQLRALAAGKAAMQGHGYFTWPACPVHHTGETP